MKKIKVVLCAIILACSLSVGIFADPPGGGVCRDGDVPLNGKCKDGNPPGLVADNSPDDKTTFEDFFDWVQSLF